MSKFMNSLETEFRILETTGSDNVNNGLGQSEQQREEKVGQKHFDKTYKPMQKQAMFASKLPCHACGEVHRLFDCQQFRGITIDERMSFV